MNGRKGKTVEKLGKNKEETKQTQGKKTNTKGRKQKTKPSFGLVTEFKHNTE
jgi:hypothetical protein